MDELDRITLDPAVCGGRPCLRATRVRVSDILELLATGTPSETILGDYPYLEAGDIAAALQYAALQSNHMILKAA